MTDWADSETHDYLDTWLRRTIVGIETGETKGGRDARSFIRLMFDNGTEVEIEAFAWNGSGASFTVQDFV